MFKYLFIFYLINISYADSNTNFLLELEHSNKALPVKFEQRIIFFKTKINAIIPENDFWEKKYNIPVIDEDGKKTYLPISAEYLNIVVKSKKIKPVKLNLNGRVIDIQRNLASENKNEKK